MSALHEHHAAGTTAAALRQTAASATLHCLTGCAIGEVLGLIIGTALGLGTVATIALAVGLAFVFGYLLSALPLLRNGLRIPEALRLVLAADTLSILTMEITDNLVMLAIPGAMDAGLLDPRFWIAMAVALSTAFVVAFPVNLRLLRRGRGHALLHEHHHGAAAGDEPGWRKHVPDPSTAALVAVITAYLLGGLTVALTAELFDDGQPHAATRPAVVVRAS